jgi:hypothetical protein
MLSAVIHVEAVSSAVLCSAPAVIHLTAVLSSTLLSFTEQLSSLLIYVYHRAADLCSVITSLFHSQSRPVVCSRYLSSVPKSLPFIQQLFF